MTLAFEFPISGRPTSIGQQARASDVAGFGTGEKCDETGDFVRAAIALERDVADAVTRQVGVRRIHVGVNHAGLDVVDSDAARSEVSGESLCETGDSPLRQRVNRSTGKRHPLTECAADMNNASALTEMPRGLLGRYNQS